MPPQLYELTRLSIEPDIDKLLPFAKQRTMNASTTLFFPIHYQTTNGLISCFPGDDFYPKKPNFVTTAHNLEEYADKTCEDCREMVNNLHRLEIKSPTDVKIWCTIHPADGHIAIRSKLDSKL